MPVLTAAYRGSTAITRIYQGANLIFGSAPAQFGVADPLLSTNINGVVDFDTAMPFIDIMKQSRPLFGDFGSQDHDYLVANGHLDAAGWPVSMPPAGTIQTVWDWSQQPTHLSGYLDGTSWALTWDGTGTVAVTGPVENVVTTANQITFDIDGSAQALSVIVTATNAAPNNVRNLRMIRADHQALYDAGETFNPDFLAAHADFRVLRFMDWQQTNNSPQVDWSGRATTSDVTYVTAQGVPIEVIIDLCNRVNADPWLCIPHLANDAYVTSLATYVRDNLSGRTPYFELSNEIWNTVTFQQHAEYLAQARAAWPGASGDPDFYVALNWYGKRAYECFGLINTVFGAQSHKNVLGTQTGYDAIGSVVEAVADAPIWLAQDAGNHAAPSSRAQHLAVTTYYGAEMADTATNEADIAAAATGVSDQLIYDTLTGVVGARDYVTELETGLGWDNTAAGSRSLTLVGYEGETHVAHGSSNTAFNDAVERFNLSSLRADITERLFNYWRNLSNVGGPYSLFVAVAPWSQFGHWSAIRFYGDTVPFYTRLQGLEAANANFFGGTGDYRHDLITGTYTPPSSVTPLNSAAVRFTGHSLFKHDEGAGNGNDQTDVPWWLDQYADEAGKTYSTGGVFTQPDDAVANWPLTPGWGWTGVTDASPAGFAAATFTDHLLTGWNFLLGEAGPNDPYNYPGQGGADTAVSWYRQVVNLADADDPGIRHHIYSGWGENLTNLATWKADNAAGGVFALYMRGIYDGVAAAEPGKDIRYIPVCEVVVDALNNTPLTSLTASDLFEDSSPHGYPVMYMLASMVTYMAVYRDKVPATYTVPAGIPAVVSANLSTIIDRMWATLGLGTPATPSTFTLADNSDGTFTVTAVPTITTPVFADNNDGTFTRSA